MKNNNYKNNKKEEKDNKINKSYDEKYYDDEEYDEDLDDYDDDDEQEENNIYQTKETNSFHNSNEYNKKITISNITHKEISKNIKEINKKNLYGSIGLLVILGIILLINSINLIIQGYEPETGFLMLIITPIGLIGIFYNFYSMFLISTGFAALIEDVNHIKNTISKTDEQNDFDDLPRL